MGNHPGHRFRIKTLVAYEHGVRRVLMASTSSWANKNMAIIAPPASRSRLQLHCCPRRFRRSGSTSSASSSPLQSAGTPQRPSRTRRRRRPHPACATTPNSTPSLKPSRAWSTVILLSGVEVYEGVLDDETAIRAPSSSVRLQSHPRPPPAGDGSTASPSSPAPAPPGLTSSLKNSAAAGFWATPSTSSSAPAAYLTHDVGAYRKAHARMLKRANPTSPTACTPSCFPRTPSVGPAFNPVPEPTLRHHRHGQARRGIRLRPSLSRPFTIVLARTTPTPARPDTVGDRDKADGPARLPSASIQRDDLRVGDMLSAFDICHPCLTLF